MGRRRRPPLGAEVEEVRDRIEGWRRTRLKRSPMPEALWEAAAQLARKHGLHPIARALGVNYQSLKRWVGRAPGGGRQVELSSAGFLELRMAELLGPAAAPGPVVELADGEGRQLVIRLTAGDPLDVVALVEAFWRRRG